MLQIQGVRIAESYQPNVRSDRVECRPLYTRPSSLATGVMLINESIYDKASDVKLPASKSLLWRNITVSDVKPLDHQNEAHAS